MAEVKSADDSTVVGPALTPANAPSLSDRYADFFTLVAAPRPFQPEYENVYFMALDAEWYEVAHRNIVLSYQIATVSREADANIIEYMGPDQRLSLAEIVEMGIRSVNHGTLPGDHRTGKTLVVLISHHVTAEWSVLADRKEPHVTKCLSVIRKSPVTGVAPIKITVGDSFLTDLHIYDTRLLAPATNQKLSELSKLLGKDDDLKINIPHYYKKRMNLYLRDYPREYEAYALQDSIVTLKLFFLLQKSLMALAGKDKLYRTLASAAVTGYLQQAGNFSAYQSALKSENFQPAYQLVKRGYHGGRSEGFFVGRSDRHPESANRLWVDVDFVGCYPTAMALCPMVDCGIDPFAMPKMSKMTVERLVKDLWVHVDHIPLTYHLEHKTDKQLLALGINPEYYRRARAALHRQHFVGPLEKRERGREPRDKDFPAVLADIARKKGGKEQVERIRNEALVVDNRLVDKWFQAWTSALESGDTNIDRHIIPGAARVRFDFKDTTSYPCLPVPHRYYGLIFPLSGETVATAPEIMLARFLGADIRALTSVELPVVGAGDGIPLRPFFDHLARLTKERNAWKHQIKNENLTPEERNNAQVYERLLKEFLNSFYGKSAQAINYRRMYDPSTGEMKQLRGSQISEPLAAALTTGLARAALGAVLVAVEQFNRLKPADSRIVIASATTDGVLLGLPRPDGINLLDVHFYQTKENGIKFNDEVVKLPEVLTLCGCGDLLKLINSYLPIRQMRNSRRELTQPDNLDPDVVELPHPDHRTQGGGDDTFLEIKHMADEILSVKTRGQIGWIKDGDQVVITILAKFGHKPPLSEIVMAGGELSKVSVEELQQKEQQYQDLYEQGGTNRNTVEGGWLMEQLDRIEQGEEDIFDYPFFGLTGFNEIIKSLEEMDLVQKVGRRRFNGDFDWKRRLDLRADGSIDPISKPFTDIREMLTYRSQMQAERRRGKNARPAKVIHRVKVRGRSIRLRGGEPATVVRMFLRGILQGHIPWVLKRETSAGIATRINRVCTIHGIVLHHGEPVANAKNRNELTRDDVENAKRSKEWEPGIIMATPVLLQLVDALADEFNIDKEQAQTQIFAQELDDEVSRRVAVQVALAVLHAPEMGINPFCDLYLKNRLPDQAGLVRAMRPHLTELDITACRQAQFFTQMLPHHDKPKVAQLLRRLAIPTSKIADCVRVLVLPPREERKVPSNPATTKCLESFVQAVLQSDIVARDVDEWPLLNKLRRYGLTEKRLAALRRRTFDPRSLTDTPPNRRQLAEMSRLIGLDVAHIMDALLDK